MKEVILLKEQIEGIKINALKEIEHTKDIIELEEIRVKYLGKKGELTALLRGMGALSAEERPFIGSLVNLVRDEIETSLEATKKKFKIAALEANLINEKIDVTEPSKKTEIGSYHPITQIINDVKDIFLGMGFSIEDGPEIEFSINNFDKLNTPANHPARDLQDTMYITENILLRTQTSPVQVRVMESQKPPIKIICPGTVYRADSVDATHSPVFHQIEGLVIDKNITMGDLKGTLETFAKKCLGEKTRY